MPKFDENSAVNTAILRSTATKFLDGNSHIEFNGLVNAAFRQHVIDPKDLAIDFGISVKDARKFGKKGFDVRPPKQRKIVQKILDAIPN